MTHSHAAKSTCPVADLSADYSPFIAPQLNDPHPIWAYARDERPVFYSAVLDAYVVTRYEDVVRVLKDADTFGPGYGARKLFARPCPEADAILAALPDVEHTNTISTEPPLHSRLRRYLQAALMPRRAVNLVPEIRRLAENLLDKVDSDGNGDFYAFFAHPFPLALIGHLIGLPAGMHAQVADWANQRVDLRFGDLSPAHQVAAAEGQRDSHAFTMALVAQRRAHPGDDLVSWMVQDSDAADDPLTDEQLAAQVTDLLSAGHETSAHFLTLLMHRVLPDRRLWAALPANDELINATTEEALRTDGPAQAIWRMAKRDVEIAGTRVPLGSRLSLALGSANVDDTVFAHPQAFTLRRPNASQHVAFGRGIHTCVGAGIARTEIRVALDVLCRRWPQLRLASDPQLTFRPSAIQRSAQRLLVEWN